MSKKPLYQLQYENAETENLGNKAVGCLAVGFMLGMALIVLTVIFVGFS